MNLALNPLEEKIFSFLLRVNSEMNLGCTFRCAGGWVRDKILGIPSNDIDIALSNMMGKDFIEQLEKYREIYEHKYNRPLTELGKTWVIPANPEKGKNMETAAAEIYNEKVEFVNLREEKYDEKSRTPTITMATGPDAPKKDAQRRDLTINSIFYNLNSGDVEDFVGGLEDLKTMTLRTPLDPVQTFKDDPLRLLRVLRFFSKYPNSKIDPKIIEAMKMPDVQNMYADLSSAFDPKKKNYKVAPERAWPELKKMMSGSKPAEALKILFETGLYRAVFNTPKFRELMDAKMDQATRHHSYNLLDHTLAVMQEMNKILEEEKVDPETRILMNFSTLFHDMGKAHPEIRKPHPKREGEYQYVGHENKSVEVAEEVLKTMGMGEKARSFVTQVIGSHMEPHKWKEAPQELAGVPSISEPRKARQYYSQLHSLLNSLVPIAKSGTKDPFPSREYSRQDLADLVMLHSIADSLGKKDEDRDLKDLAAKQQHRKHLKSYSPFWAGLQPLLTGNDLMSMFKDLDPKKVVNGKNFITDLKERLHEKQATGFISNREEAAKFVSQLRPMLNERYRKENPNQVKAWVATNCRFCLSSLVRRMLSEN